MSLSKLIDKVLTEIQAQRNPYFQDLKSGAFKKEDFLETQIQFYYAVIFFSRPMAALAAKIPVPELRMEILRNVWEEHGEGSLANGHGATFLTFLQRIGSITPSQVFHRGLWPEIRIFNTTLTGVTIMDDFIIGVATMGIIERMFSEISAWIGQGVIERKWISQEDLVHYKLHEQLDIRHSQDFFNILEEPFKKSDENKYHIEQGLRLGATLFNNLYKGLWEARQRRWVLSAPFPPSRSADFIP